LQRIVIDLRISPEEYQKMYAGLAQSVFARARDGRKVRFPANLLRRFVTAQGVVGSFEFQLDEHNKVQQFRRLNS
jgi:hypothetical protein